MRLLGIALLGLIVGCGGGTAPVTPPPEPPAGTLYKLEPSLKPIPNSDLNTRAPTAEEFWVGKGKSLTLTINAKQLSPLAKKVRLEISASGSGLGLAYSANGSCVFDNQGRCVLSGSAKAELTVTLEAGVPSDAVPYFFVYGFPLNDNNNALSEQLRLDYRWNLARPPAAPPATPPATP